MLLCVLLLIAFASLIASVASYFFVKIKTFSFAVLLFYTCNTVLSFFLIHDNHTALFYVTVIPLVAFPVVCLVLFACDVRYGLFCIDSSFVLFFVWLLIPVLFTVNLTIYLVTALFYA